MSLNELENWIRDAKFICITNESKDHCNNIWYDKIYLKDGNYYKIMHFNHKLCELSMFDDTNIYCNPDPIKVSKTTQTIDVYK